MSNQTEADKEQEQEFVLQIEKKINWFQKSGRDYVRLKPMNSYYRRLSHKMADSLGLFTCSEGEGPDRHIVVHRLKKSLEKPTPMMPESSQNYKWDFGDREFFVNSLQAEVEIFLGRDGTVGLSEVSGQNYITKRKITTKSFKIRKDQIVIIHDNEW